MAQAYSSHNMLHSMTIINYQADKRKSDVDTIAPSPFSSDNFNRKFSLSGAKKTYPQK